MNRPTHFEIHADDLDRAQKFYSAVFGWTFQKWEDKAAGATEYLMITTGKADTVGPDGRTWPGINGGMLKRMGPPPTDTAAVNGYVVTMDIENIDETISKIIAAGGKEALPKFAMPGMAWLAYFKDTEGNIFGIFQNDPNAK